MSVDLRGRSLLTLRDFSPEEIEYLVDLSLQLKEKKRRGVVGSELVGKNVVLIFEKTSTRTRCAFEVAVYDEGGHSTFLSNSQMGVKESVEDTARVLGRFYDGIEFRGFRQETIEDLARYAGVPVWNGLTDMYHPTQVLADFMTLREHLGCSWGEMRLGFVGDGRSNVAHSLLIGAAKLGMDFVVVAPEALFPGGVVLEDAERVGKETGARICVTDDVGGVEGCGALYTDVWASLGEEDRFGERIGLLREYQVNRALMDRTGVSGCLFLHCLPAFHDGKTGIGERIGREYGLDCMEVTDDVFRSEESVVFDQAENRLHAAKAVMVATI